MKRMLMMSVCAMVAAAGAASADPVTSDDLLKAQDSGKEWLTYGREYRNWLQPTHRNHSRHRPEAHAGVGYVHRRPARRP